MRISVAPHRGGQQKIQLQIRLLLSRQSREQKRIIVRAKRDKKYVLYLHILLNAKAFGKIL
jgi:hypothetical protein